MARLDGRKKAPIEPVKPNRGSKSAASGARTGEKPQMPRMTFWAIIAGSAVVLLAVFAGSVVYTDRSPFCDTCHEMRPFYAAWTQSKMHKVSCVSCHVSAGPVNHTLHKFVALREVWDHFTSAPTFPMYGIDVPDNRCTNCHKNLNVARPPTRFSHAVHAGKASCAQCHGASAHMVTYTALQAAGVLRSGSQQPGTTYIAQLAFADKRGSALIGHKKVECSRCHDMANAQCSTCHPEPANHFGPDCKLCHKPTIPFPKTVFSHPAFRSAHGWRIFPCTACHPKGYTTHSCTCHGGGNGPTGD
jgi:nitrate/TMAO reductase-like tetraheme cytochrome c subunit